MATGCVPIRHNLPPEQRLLEPGPGVGGPGPGVLGPIAVGQGSMMGGPGMGGPMMGGGKPVAGYRLIGAIVEGPGGSVFFKLTGPAKTIAAQQKNFEQLLASIQVDK